MTSYRPVVYMPAARRIGDKRRAGRKLKGEFGKDKLDLKETLDSLYSLLDHQLLELYSGVRKEMEKRNLKAR